MCWNASVSLNTYALGLFASSLSLYNGDSNIRGFIFYNSIVIIQLIEYFIWSNTFSNRLLSQIMLFVLISQPFLNILKIEKRPDLVPYLLAGYILFIVIVYTTLIPLNTVDFSSVPSKNGHLSWNWLNWNIYILVIWYAFLSARWIIDNMYITLVVITIFLIVSIILFKETKTYGSMWCWIVNIVSFYLILRVFHNDFCKI
jgi:hypothetical protein